MISQTGRHFANPSDEKEGTMLDPFYGDFLAKQRIRELQREARAIRESRKLHRRRCWRR